MSNFGSRRYTITHSTPEVIPQLLCERVTNINVIFRAANKRYIDVVVPIPLPLSAILILVIGMNRSPLVA